MARGSVLLTVGGMDAFWHPAFGVVLIVLIQIGEHISISAYYAECDERDAQSLMSVAQGKFRKIEARLN